MHWNALNELFNARAVITDHPCGAGKGLPDTSFAIGESGAGEVWLVCCRGDGLAVLDGTSGRISWISKPRIGGRMICQCCRSFWYSFSSAICVWSTQIS